MSLGFVLSDAPRHHVNDRHFMSQWNIFYSRENFEPLKSGEQVVTQASMFLNDDGQLLKTAERLKLEQLLFVLL